MLPKIIKATFTGIPDKDELEEIVENCDLSRADIRKMKAHAWKDCELTLNCFVDENDFEANYYDAKFEDGWEMNWGLSGIYFDFYDMSCE